MSMSREQSLSEEIANSISHGLGLVAAIAAIPLLIITVLKRGGDAANIVGVCVFSASMVLLYLASTLYHAVTHDRAKYFFRLLDHSAIFLLIAGTYTPFTLGILRGTWGWTLFGLIWGLAVFGVILKIVKGFNHSKLSMALYLIMGWLVLIAAKPVIQSVPLSGLALILAGGIAYTVGVAFYAAHHIRFAHFVWHIFVIMGTTFHFFAVLWYAS